MWDRKINDMEHTFTDQNFQSDVLESTTPVLVDFWATWCPPCRLTSPIIEELANEVDPAKLKIGKLNVDDSGQTAMTYRVMSIPTFIVFEGGKVVDQFSGAMSKEEFKTKLAKYFA